MIFCLTPQIPLLKERGRSEEIIFHLKTNQHPDNNREESRTLNEGDSQNHVSPDITERFRLTGNGLKSSTTNYSDSDSCTGCCCSCANGGKTVSYFC